MHGNSRILPVSRARSRRPGSERLDSGIAGWGSRGEIKTPGKAEAREEPERPEPSRDGSDRSARGLLPAKKHHTAPDRDQKDATRLSRKITACIRPGTERKKSSPDLLPIFLRRTSGGLDDSCAPKGGRLLNHALGAHWPRHSKPKPPNNTARRVIKGACCVHGRDSDSHSGQK